MDMTLRSFDGWSSSRLLSEYRLQTSAVGTVSRNLHAAVAADFGVLLRCACWTLGVPRSRNSSQSGTYPGVAHLVNASLLTGRSVYERHGDCQSWETAPGDPV